MTMSDIRRMPLGQTVDFVIAYNERNEQKEEKKPKDDKPRKATQADINAFFG